MKRSIIIVIIVALVLVIGLAIYFLSSRSIGPVANNGANGTLPPVSTSTVSHPSSTADTIELGTSQGTVVVNNFYKNAALVTPDGGTVFVVTTTSYNLAYNVNDSSFAIALLSQPLAVARVAAEAELLASLGVSQTDACRLAVTEEVPVSVDPDYAGKNLGLSFCPGAASL